MKIKIKKMLVLFCVLFVFMSCQNKDFKKIEWMIEQQRDTEINEYKIFRSPTYPEKIDYIIPEWEDTQYLVLSLPYDDVFSDEDITKYYIDIIKTAIDYTNLLVLINEDELGALNDLIEKLNEAGLKEKINRGSPSQIRILQTRFNTKWVRDFGPVFGKRRHNNCLYIIDSIYRDVRDEENHNGGGDIYKRSSDDAIPLYISTFLYNNSDDPIKVIKPPLQLWGGDFQTDGKGNILTSTETLKMNGANKEDVDLIFKYYFGMEKIVYLNPLPGQTVKHIDMVLKVVDENTILVGSYNQNGKETTVNEYVKYLQKEVNLVLYENYSLLKKEFPDKKIIKMPMPGISIKIDDDVKLIYYKNILNMLLDPTEYRKDDIDYMSLEELEESIVIYARKSLKQELGLSEENTGIEWILDYVIAEYLSEFLKDDPDAYVYIYRTYLNSTYIKGKEKNLLLVPGYRGWEELETKVRDIYESVYPNTDIVFINSDSIIKQYGTIHCITLSIPKLKAPKKN